MSSLRSVNIFYPASTAVTLISLCSFINPLAAKPVLIILTNVHRLKLFHIEVEEKSIDVTSHAPKCLKFAIKLTKE